MKKPTVFSHFDRKGGMLDRVRVRVRSRVELNFKFLPSKFSSDQDILKMTFLKYGWLL